MELISEGQEIPLTVIPRKRGSFTVSAELSANLPCGDLLDGVIECLSEMEDPSLAVGKWRLVERWRGLEHKLPRGENFLDSMRKWGCYYQEVDYLVKQTDLQSLPQKLPSAGRSSPQKWQTVKEKSCLPLTLSKPGSQLGKKRKITSQERAVRHCSQRQRQLLVKKLRQPLVFGHNPTRKAELIMQGFSSQLASATQLNEKLAAEVSDMNHEATSLAEKLSALRQYAKVQGTSLSQAKSKVSAQQQQLKFEVEKKVAEIEAEVVVTRKDLDKRQRLNDLQNSKLQLVQEELSALQATLKMKERELQQMKRCTKGETDPIQALQNSRKKEVGNHKTSDNSDSSANSKNDVDSHCLGTSGSGDMSESVSNVSFQGSQVAFEEDHYGDTFPDVFLGQKSPTASASQDSEGVLLGARSSSLKYSTCKPVSQTPEPFHGSPSDTSSDSVSSHDSFRIRRGRLTESARKRFNSFLEKTRCLVLEEGKVFKKAHDTKATTKDVTNQRLTHNLNEPTYSGLADLTSGLLEASLDEAGTPFPKTVESNTMESKLYPVHAEDDEDHSEEATQGDDLHREVDKGNAGEKDLSPCEDGKKQVLLTSENDANQEQLALHTHSKTAVNANTNQTASPSIAAKLLSDVIISLESMKQERRSKPLATTTNKGGILKRTAKRSSAHVGLPTKCRVRFSPESLILNAALEGDLTLLRKCVLQLGGSTVTSVKGATCLHNAVCSGNLHAMEYLIELGCDINAVDSDGWTPLHCAVAYLNLPAIQLLIKNGASLFLRTCDGQTPLGILQEDVEGLEELIDDTTRQCYIFLNRMHKELGVIDSGRVHTLFSYVAVSNDELSFVEGEQLTILSRDVESGWWRAKNARRQTGYVPSTYLGLHPRCHIVV